MVYKDKYPEKKEIRCFFKSSYKLDSSHNSRGSWSQKYEPNEKKAVICEESIIGFLLIYSNYQMEFKHRFQEA